MKTDNTYVKETVAGALKTDRGFTLIEVLVAVSIFAVGMLAVGAMQTSAIRGNSTAGDITELRTWGMDKLEELMSYVYTNPWLEEANPPDQDSAGNVHQETNADGISFSWNILNGTPAANTPVPNTKQITLTVTARGKTLRLVCIKSQSL